MTDCGKCEREKNKAGVDGSPACSWCVSYKEACEVRSLLKKSLHERRFFLVLAEKSRGKLAVDRLKHNLAVMWRKNRPTD